jgi:VWFA-related protein
MKPKIRQAREAVGRLLRTGIEGDEYFLVAFSDRPRTLTEMVRNPDKILQKLPHIRAGGWTALLDAADLSLTIMRSAGNNRKALVLLSDGEDNRSRFTETELRQRIRESDTCFYAIGLLGEDQSDGNLRLLADLAKETGGLMLPVAELADLPHAIEQIAVNLRNQYVLGYAPTGPYDGRYRHVNVRLTTPEAQRLRASWRAGYYSPASTR